MSKISFKEFCDYKFAIINDESLEGYDKESAVTNPDDYDFAIYELPFEEPENCSVYFDEVYFDISYDSSNGKVEYHIWVGNDSGASSGYKFDSLPSEEEVAKFTSVAVANYCRDVSSRSKSTVDPSEYYGVAPDQVDHFIEGMELFDDEDIARAYAHDMSKD